MIYPHVLEDGPVDRDRRNEHHQQFPAGSFSSSDRYIMKQKVNCPHRRFKKVKLKAKDCN